MMRLVQMIWQVLMILISVYIGWLFIRCMRRYSDSHKEKKGDSNAERNAHKDENIAAISLTYNYKEFIMKKIISSLRICHGWNG